MNPSRKTLALAGGFVAALTAVSLAQGQNPKTGRPAGAATDGNSNTVVVGGTIAWLEESDLSAKREGVIKQIEFRIGKRVEEGQEIGSLYDDIARLTVAKAKIAATNVGEIEKGKAQVAYSYAAMARLKRLKAKGEFVSVDELEKGEAEVKVAEAGLKVAIETQALAKAELDLAVQTQLEHRIVAPFSGLITELKKHAGEAVRANEAVVHLCRTDKLRFVGYVPIEAAFRIRPNDVVEVRPTIEGSDLPIEKLVFHGKVTSIDPEVVPQRSNHVRVLAEVDNPPNDEHSNLVLRKGMKADMTIYLNGATPNAVGQAAGPRDNKRQ